MPEVSPDAKAHRDWLLSVLPVQNAMSIVDLGCGDGRDLIAFAHGHPDIDGDSLAWTAPKRA
jgi:tRNA G46 methylase TrmB